MSRSGYVDECDMDGPNTIGLWCANVARTISSKRGQEFLREVRDALDAMPEKRLIVEDLVTPEGECCTMGAVCVARGLDVAEVDPEEPDDVARLFGISSMMAREIAYENDETHYVYPEGGSGFNAEGQWVVRTGRPETPEERWTRMRAWVEKQIIAAPSLRNEEGSE